MTGQNGLAPFKLMPSLIYHTSHRVTRSCLPAGEGPLRLHTVIVTLKWVTAGLQLQS